MGQSDTSNKFFEDEKLGGLLGNMVGSDTENSNTDSTAPAGGTTEQTNEPVHSSR